MGSPKTRPTVAASWPRNADAQRRMIRELAEDGRILLQEVLEAMDKGNPLIARAAIGFLDAKLADIQRLAVEARIGPEPTLPADNQA